MDSDGHKCDCDFCCVGDGDCTLGRANGEKPEEIPLVEGIVTYDPGDWGLSNTPRFLKVTPPHRLELIPETEAK